MRHEAMADDTDLNLTATEAYQLALVHSTSYQEEYEDLYLSALDVSAERFRFDTQFFAGYSSFYETSGPLRNQNNSGNLRNGLEVATSTDETGRLGLPAGGVRAPNQGNLLLRKSFITGADLAVGLANELNTKR